MVPLKIIIKEILDLDAPIDVIKVIYLSLL